MQAYVWWFVLGLALAGAELLTGTFYLLILALGAAAGGVVAMSGGPLAFQLVVAALIGAGGSLWLQRRRAAAAAVPDLVQNPDVGQTVRVDAWKSDRSARAQYRGAVWDVELAPGEAPVAGDFEIRAIVNNRLVLGRRRAG